MSVYMHAARWTESLLRGTFIYMIINHKFDQLCKLPMIFTNKLGEVINVLNWQANASSTY